MACTLQIHHGHMDEWSSKLKMVVSFLSFSFFLCDDTFVTIDSEDAWCHASCHTCECVMSHMCIRLVTHVNASAHTFECMSHVSMRQVTYMNGSCHMSISHATHSENQALEDLLSTCDRCCWSLPCSQAPTFYGPQTHLLNLDLTVRRSTSPLIFLSPHFPLSSSFSCLILPRNTEKTSIRHTLSLPPTLHKSNNKYSFHDLKQCKSFIFSFPFLNLFLSILFETLWNQRRKLHNSICIESYDRWEKFVLFYSNVTHSTVKIALGHLRMWNKVHKF